MRLALVKLILSILASIGFWLPHNRLLHCPPGGGNPVDCQVVHVTPTYLK